MNHHNEKQYLLESIKILSWSLSTKNGLSCTYELEGNTYYLMAEPFRLTTLLSNVDLINDRRIREGRLQVQLNDVWMPFYWYVPMAKYSSADLLLICTEHEILKPIMAMSEVSFMARMKPICIN